MAHMVLILVHSSIDGHLGCFYVLAITNNTAVITGVKFLCVSEVLSDGNSILAKCLVTQGYRVLTCMSGVSLSLVPGSGCLSCITREWGQCAHLCLSHSCCSVLISPLRMKAHRKQAARRLKGRDDEDAVMGTIALGSKQKPQPDSPPEHTPPAGDAPSSGEQQEEPHYANLNFQGIKLREPQDQETTSTTEYSEINTRK